MPSNKIDLSRIDNDIEQYIIDYCIKYNIDLNDYRFLTTLRHSTINHLLTSIHNDLLSDKDYKPYLHNTNINYDSIEELTYFANKFIELCQRFNKSLGLYSFGCLISAAPPTLAEWLTEEGQKANPARAELLHMIQEKHKGQHVSLMNDTGLGLLAVANNDHETGLKWADNQRQAVERQAVYFLPSERLERLKIEPIKEDGETVRRV